MSTATSQPRSPVASSASPPPHARLVLEQIVPATATKSGYLVLTLPGSNYRLHLRAGVDAEAMRPLVGKKVSGTILASGNRVDVHETGGRYVEPVAGRPRIVHGTVLAADDAAGTLTLHAGGSATVDGLPLPVTIKLTDARQKPSDFRLGTLVGCSVLDGATFTPRG